ncbi:uncharacterized protein LOC143031818 [Oratosquilla oratoria]|uniref:uncharacterized protein LOC143031818 n=1 Tax=Oratosquilla oratoria TaxID=337810 RepID=UPI003F775105
MNRSSYYRKDNPECHIVITSDEELPPKRNVGAPYVLCAFAVGVILMGVGTFITANAQENLSEKFVLFVVGLSLLSAGGLFLLGAVIVCAVACCKNRSLQPAISGDILHCGESTFYGNKSLLLVPEEEEEDEDEKGANKGGQDNAFGRRTSSRRRKEGRINLACGDDHPESGVEVLAKTVTEERHRMQVSPPGYHRSSGNFELDMISLERLGLDHIGLERLHRVHAQEVLARDFESYHPEVTLENDKQQRGRSYSMTTRGQSGEPVKLIRNVTYNNTMRINRKHRQEQHLHLQEQHYRYMQQKQQRKQLHQEHFDALEHQRYRASPSAKETGNEGDWEVEDDEIAGVRGFARRFQRKRSKKKKSQREGDLTPEIIYPLPSCSQELLEAAGIVSHTSSLDRGTHHSRPDAEEANTGNKDSPPAPHPHHRLRPGRGSEKQRRPSMGVSSLKKSSSMTSTHLYLQKSMSSSPASSLPRKSYHSSDVDLNKAIDSTGSLPRSQKSYESMDHEITIQCRSPTTSNTTSVKQALQFGPSLQSQNITNGSSNSLPVCEFVPPPPPDSPPPSEPPCLPGFHKTNPITIYPSPSSSSSSVTSTPPRIHICRGRVLSDIASSCCSASDEDGG